MDKSNKVRLQVYLPEEIMEWVKSQADVYGMSISSYVSMAVVQYKQQMEGFKMLQDIPTLLATMERLANSNSDVKNEVKE